MVRMQSRLKGGSGMNPVSDYLTVTAADGRSFRREIGPEGLSIGRSSQNDLVLEDPGVSRSHARITLFPDGYFLLDAGGKNGTFLNESRVASPTLLRLGDNIRVGSTLLTFNASASSPVEFVDKPLPAGPATMVLQVRDAVVSSGVHSFSGGDTDASIQAILPVTSLSTGSGTRSFAASPALNIIFEADKELVFHRPLPQILEKIIDLVGKAVPFDRGLLMLLEDGRLVPRVVRVPPGEEGRTISISQTIANRVIQAQESVLTADALADARFSEGQSIVAQQIRSAMCVPLWNNQDVIGLIYIDSRRRAGLFLEEHLRLLSHLANVAAVKIENVRLFEQRVEAERTEQELEKAWEIQKILLPSQSPPIPGYLLYGTSDPCRVVGGDLYDYIELPGGRTVVALGDVAGKGYPAALLMCFFQAALRALCELDLPPEETIERLNRVLCKRFPDNRFVTFFYGLLDPVAHVFTYVNAGHCPAWIVPRDRSTGRLESTGGPLGMFEGGRYESRTIALQPGEALVCYSDGVTECADSQGEEFGEERLIGVVKRCLTSQPGEIVQQIASEVAAHHKGAQREDDLTLVILKRDAA